MSGSQAEIKAVSAYEYARSKLGKINGKNGSGVEANYAQAYQRLVVLGLKPQIRLRYR